MHHHAIWRAGPGVNPPCRIGGGSDLAAPHEFGAFGPAQLLSPAGPPNQTLRRAQPPGWNVHPVDPVRVGPVDNLAVGLRPTCRRDIVGPILPSNGRSHLPWVGNRRSGGGVGPYLSLAV